MHIVFASSECSPWARTGGLAEVVSALSKALVAQGHRVSVFLPYYRQVAKLLPAAPVVLRSITIPFPGYNRFVRVRDGGLGGGVEHYFVECPEMFDRENIYGTFSREYDDNAERFGLFCRAVIEAAKLLGVPDVFHVHDWQSAMVAVMLGSVYDSDPVLQKVPVVLTIHNAAQQGQFEPKTIDMLLLPWELYTSEKLEFYDSVGFLKGGIVYADAITTVSRTYAEEIQTPEFGNGLDGILRQRSGDLFGIQDGVDYSEWDPAVDPHIAAHYTAERLGGKRECRRDLLHAFGLQQTDEETAVVGVISKFTTRKGFDLLVESMEKMVAEDLVLVMLGSGEDFYERLLVEMAQRYPTKVKVQVQYDEVMAHKIEAGADMLLMPSRYEPCGLNQIYGLKYGTVPVVRATGGLKDTVDEQPDGGGTGFRFWGYDAAEMMGAIQRALKVFRDKERWVAMMQRGMAQDFSWGVPVGEYVRLYERVRQSRA